MDIVLRSAAAFVFVFALLRVMGRRELSTLEPFDVILLVVIGDLVQQGVTQSDMSLTGTLPTKRPGGLHSDRGRCSSRRE